MWFNIIVLNCVVVFPAPSAPPEVSVTLVTSYFIVLQLEVPCQHQNWDTTGYFVQYRECGNETVMNITEFGVTEITIFNLMNSTCYLFQVAAINSAGTGVFSNATIINTTDNGEFQSF